MRKQPTTLMNTLVLTLNVPTAHREMMPRCPQGSL